MSYETDGYCIECGDEVDEPYHRYCRSCYAEQQGWGRPDANHIAAQHQARERISLTLLVERVAELERQNQHLQNVVNHLLRRLDRVERQAVADAVRTYSAALDGDPNKILGPPVPER